MTAHAAGIMVIATMECSFREELKLARLRRSSNFVVADWCSNTTRPYLTSAKGLALLPKDSIKPLVSTAVNFRIANIINDLFTEPNKLIAVVNVKLLVRFDLCLLAVCPYSVS